MLRPGDKVLVCTRSSPNEPDHRARRERTVSAFWRRFRMGVLLYAVVLAVASVFGVWLFVLGLGSAGVALVRHRILARRQLPARLAAWAVHAPRGLSPPVALEHVIAVDLAAVSQGQVDCIHRAQSVVAGSIDDPWRRALANERLARAHDLVVRGGVVGVSARHETPPVRLRHSAGMVLLTVFLALGIITQSRWWLIPLAVVGTLLTVEIVDFYERRRALPELLASRSVQDPVQGLFVMFEHDVARSLVGLARNDRMVIHRARCVVEASSERAHAHQRLIEAERLVANAAAPQRRRGLWLGAFLAPAAATPTVPRWPIR